MKKRETLAGSVSEDLWRDLVIANFVIGEGLGYRGAELTKFVARTTAQDFEVTLSRGDDSPRVSLIEE